MPDCLRYAFLRRTDVAPCGKCPPCLAGPTDPEPEAPAPEPADERTRLQVEAVALGIELDKRWGVKRLRTEIAAAG